MVTGKKSGPGGSGTKRRSHYCSFCGKGEREVGPMIEGPDSIFICGACVDLCANIIRQEERKLSKGSDLFGETPAPREIKEFLDKRNKSDEKFDRIMKRKKEMSQ